jgi:hypothetical protein
MVEAQIEKSHSSKFCPPFEKLNQPSGTVLTPQVVVDPHDSNDPFWND